MNSVEDSGVSMTLDLPTLADTHAAAAALAPLVSPGDVLCLSGDLGAGKTAFVAGLARALGAEGEVLSPTFTLENRHRIVDPRPHGPVELWHYDLYRPGDDARRDLLPSMLDGRSEGVLLAIEWAAPVAAWLTPQLWIELTLRAGGARRLRQWAVPEGWPRQAALMRAWAPWRREARR